MKLSNILVTIMLVLVASACSSTTPPVEQLPPTTVVKTVYKEPVYVEVTHPELPERLQVPVIYVEVKTVKTIMTELRKTAAESNQLSPEEMKQFLQWMEFIELLQLQKDPMIMETMDQENAEANAVYLESLIQRLETFREVVDYYRTNEKLTLRP